MLPRGADPWLLNLQHGGPIFLLQFRSYRSGAFIQVDSSGRHFNEGEVALKPWRKLRNEDACPFRMTPIS
jgi:hypothetical protein